MDKYTLKKNINLMHLITPCQQVIYLKEKGCLESILLKSSRNEYFPIVDTVKNK